MEDPGPSSRRGFSTAAGHPGIEQADAPGMRTPDRFPYLSISLASGLPRRQGAAPREKDHESDERSREPIGGDDCRQFDH